MVFGAAIRFPDPVQLLLAVSRSQKDNQRRSLTGGEHQQVGMSAASGKQSNYSCPDCTLVGLLYSRDPERFTGSGPAVTDRL